MPVICSHCGSSRTCKAGFTRNAKQRYYCRACRRFSRDNPITRSRSRAQQQQKIKGKLPPRGSLVLQLLAIAQDLGRTPTTADIAYFSKQKRCACLDVFYAVFGDFNTALKSARLRPNYRQEFDRDYLLAELRALRQRVGRPLIQKDVAEARRQGRCSPVCHFQRAFGSVPLAIKAAGAGHQKPTREELLKQLRDLQISLGRAPREQDITAAYRSGHGASLKRFEKEFGTLEKARRAAGIIAGAWRPYTREQLLEQLKALGQKLGRKPTTKEINAGSQRGEIASASAFADHFGSLMAAYREAGFNPRPRRHTEAEVIKQLQRLARRLGRVPRYVDIEAASREGLCASPNTIYRFFGTLENAIVKAHLTTPASSRE